MSNPSETALRSISKEALKVAEKLRECKCCEGTGELCEMDHSCSLEACETARGYEDCPHCPHCADNRAEADRLEALAKSWCCKSIINAHCAKSPEERRQPDGRGLVCNFGKVWCKETQCDYYVPESEGIVSPDFLTWSGHGKLIEMIQQVPGLFDKFATGYLWDKLLEPECQTGYHITITTPVLFLQAFNSFMEER